VTSSDSDNHVQTLNNVASEKAVLSGLINHGINAFVDVQSIVKEDSFTVDNNKVIFKCVSKALETSSSIDLTSVLSAAKQLDLDEYLNKPDVLKHLQHLMRYEVKLENVRTHALKIRKLQFSRELQNSLRHIFLALNEVDGDQSVTEILSIAEGRIEEIASEYIREDKTNPQLIGHNVIDYVESLMEQEIRPPGISTGYPAFDLAIGGGLRRQCVDLIGARSKAGKSVLADNVAEFVTDIGDRGIPVLMLDTEMSETDHQNRLLALLSGVAINDVSSSAFKVNEGSVDNVRQAAQTLSERPYHYINVSGRPFDEILSVARRWLLKEVGYDKNGRMNDCLIIYDYLKLMSSDSLNGNMAEFQALGFQITKLHNFCVQYDCPCLSFVQLNRDGITKETEDAVSGSDRLIWLATSFSIFKIKTDEEFAQDKALYGEKAGNRKLIPVVSRHGPGMEGGYICMQMTGDIAEIKELGTLKEIQKEKELKNDGVPDRAAEEVDEETGD
jgi:replicative DNA helicase